MMLTVILQATASGAQSGPGHTIICWHSSGLMVCRFGRNIYFAANHRLATCMSREKREHWLQWLVRLLLQDDVTDKIKCSCVFVCVAATSSTNCNITTADIYNTPSFERIPSVQLTRHQHHQDLNTDNPTKQHGQSERHCESRAHEPNYKHGDWLTNSFRVTVQFSAYKSVQAYILLCCYANAFVLATETKHCWNCYEKVKDNYFTR